MADRGLVTRRMRRLAVGTIAYAGGGFLFLPALADTLDGSLVLAYMNNPTLNAQRAAARATDEGGWWWEVPVPEISARENVRNARARYEKDKLGQKP